MVHPYIYAMHVLRLLVLKKLAFSEKLNKQEKNTDFVRFSIYLLCSIEL